jgi:excisionase family DNA binding protein
MQKERYITIAQLAAMLGVSRIAVYKKVRQGRIKAIRIGRAFAIPRRAVLVLVGNTLTSRDKKQIDVAISRTMKEYGETLRLLGGE